MNTKTTGQFIAKKRKEKKMTQSELAEILQVTDKAISRWETGEGYPEVTILPKLAYTLGVSVDELLNGDQAIGCETTSVKVVSLFEMISRVSLAFILFGLLIGIGLIYLKEDKFVSLIPLSIGWFIGFVVYQYGKYQYIRSSVFNDLDKFTIYRQSKLQIITLISSIAILLPQFVLKYIVEEMGYGMIYILNEDYLDFLSFLWSSAVTLMLSIPISMVVLKIYKSVTYKHESIVHNQNIYRTIMAGMFLFIFIFFGIMIYDFVWSTMDRLMFFIPIVILLPNVYLAIVDKKGAIGLLISMVLSIGLILTSIAHDQTVPFDQPGQFIEYFDYSSAFFLITWIGSAFMMIYEVKTEQKYNERFFSYLRNIIITITFIVLFFTYTERSMHAFAGFVTIPAILIGFGFELLFRKPIYLKKAFLMVLPVMLIVLLLSITQPVLYTKYRIDAYIWDVVMGFSIINPAFNIHGSYWILIPPIGLFVLIVLFGAKHVLIKNKWIHLGLDSLFSLLFLGLALFTCILSIDYSSMMVQVINYYPSGISTGAFMWITVGISMSILTWINTAIRMVDQPSL
ncbi:helix-turn-helix domain-containing protein [Paracholeplasma manati]|uniref:helix-turn-helix domain-containing protein n=1 Tax=Paracholeplasma manati TaxID=591373 RepID=UPI00240827DF|nr:helix-turn-helix transcriptional regulator [Paracholeplasma manati]MDG0889104.1 helix-turn-helix transcriptional regulator [Paracholeplasma manati]